MNKLFNTGLVVGKFCPLHKGHQLVIDTAIRQCRNVIVISYTKPEFESCEPDNRELWIAELYPSVKHLVIDDSKLRSICISKNISTREVPENDATEANHRNFVGWLCYFVLGTTVDAVFTSENYGDGFAVALSDYFSVQTNTTVSVCHVCVDKPRISIPVSGTNIRLDLEANHPYLAPAVYSDLLCRVAILGGESSGKTTLAKSLARHFNTSWVPEYGRELWEQQEGHLQMTDMPRIAIEQVAQERLIGRQARQLLFCDTTPLTTLFYSQEMFKYIDPVLEKLANRKYGRIILCTPDFDFVQDGTRQSAEFRARQHEWYIEQFKNRGLEYLIVSGSVRERVKNISAIIGQDIARIKNDRIFRT
jgi:HTH-type transcriptional regulator, transcriptional repressor of NAD biosynthesis genes